MGYQAEYAGVCQGSVIQQATFKEDKKEEW